jgi:hypothetical protein
MAEAADLDAESRRQNLILAKILLRKFGILHEFHAQQLERFTVACCHSSICGEVIVNGDEKSVTYDIKTFRFFKKNGNQTLPRNKFSVMGYLKFPPRKYEADKKLAKENLVSWTKELLWPDTVVKVIIDGQSI